MRDYQLVSPSLDGIISHESMVYDGVRRPLDLLRSLDGPAATQKKDKSNALQNQKMLEEYMQDLYGVFLKRLTFFFVASEIVSEDTLKMQAMLQEMIKVKKLLEKERTIVTGNGEGTA
jgi:hypothetical protein